MATKVTFHCDAGHNLTFKVSELTHALLITRKNENDLLATCEDYKRNPMSKAFFCMQCEHCIATEVHDDN